MQDLIIKKSKDKTTTMPAVAFLAEAGTCCLEGKSYMQDAFEFYEPIIEWIDNYFKNYKEKPLKFILKLTYYNTASSKMLYDVIILLQKYIQEGRNIKIEWHFDPMDEDFEEDIQDFIDATDTEIELIEIDED